VRQNITYTPTKKTNGFTLIEMLTVIGMIVLLASMAVPSFMRAVQLSKIAATRARISALASACEMYRLDTAGQRYYPGQQYPEMLLGTTDRFPSDTALPEKPKMTGSEVLALSLFNAKKGTATDRAGFRAVTSGAYLNYADDWFLKKDSTNLIITDLTNDNKAIVYYPSRVGQTGKDGTVFNAFSYQDNATLTDPYGGDITAFNKFIENPKFTNTPYNEKTFLLMAPGIDRTYFSPDSPRNFGL